MTMIFDTSFSSLYTEMSKSEKTTGLPRLSKLGCVKPKTCYNEQLLTSKHRIAKSII